MEITRKIKEELTKEQFNLVAYQISQIGIAEAKTDISGMKKSIQDAVGILLTNNMIEAGNKVERYLSIID